MNILYISNLSGSKFAGPSYSVPEQIRAQAKYDNVFWLNLNKYKWGIKVLKQFGAM